jgi:hypothetical protein
MTGASRFLHAFESPAWYLSPSRSSPSSSEPHWTYNKSDTLTDFSSFDFLLTSDPTPHLDTGLFDVVESFAGFERYQMTVPGKWWESGPLRAVVRESVWVMRRRGV